MRAVPWVVATLVVSLLGVAALLLLGRRVLASADKDRGLTLARQYCTACHELPSPDQLPKESWPFVVDWMGNYLGIRKTEGYLGNVVNRSSIPPRPLISSTELARINAYFVSNAPVGPLRPHGKPDVLGGVPWMHARDDGFLQARNAIITLVEIDEANRRLFVGHGNENRLLIYDDSGEHLGGAEFDTQPIAVTVQDQGFYLTLIGDLMRDTRNGQVLDLQLEGGGVRGNRLIAGYHRTVDADFGDLTGDGRTDIVAAGFGDFHLGRLAWFENVGAAGYEEHVLLDHSGAVEAEVHDFDHDGLLDIMTLVAQGRQELLLFLNLGDGRFEPMQLLRKPPGFGFNSFELADFNDDGRVDILLVNGNNMEIPDPPLRDYHGLRILLNEGELRFREAYFYPMYGAIGARVADFNGNGSLDIAAIAAFPDWSHERPEGFVLLEQSAPMRFTPHTHPSTQGGRWLTIDAGDLNGDGSADLVLGGGGFLHGIPLPMQSDFIERYNQMPPVLVLENAGSAAAP